MERLANSGAVWLMVGFLVGSRMPSISWVMVAGVATLITAIAGYYLAAVVADAGFSASSVAIWGTAAVMGGPVFGVARGGRGDAHPVAKVALRLGVTLPPQAGAKVLDA